MFGSAKGKQQKKNSTAAISGTVYIDHIPYYFSVMSLEIAIFFRQRFSKELYLLFRPFFLFFIQRKPEVCFYDPVRM